MHWNESHSVTVAV